MKTFIVYVDGVATEWIVANDLESATEQAGIKWQGYSISVFEETE